MKKVLITYFEPFADFKENSSELICQNLNIEGVKTIRVSCTYANCFFNVKEEIAEYQPDYIILTGQADSRKQLSIEKYAYNLDDCKVTDNANEVRINKIIDESGKSILETKIDVEHIAEEIKDAYVSKDPGRFVCNHLYFETLNYLDKNACNIPTMFVHFPSIHDDLDKYIFLIGNIINMLK